MAGQLVPAGGSSFQQQGQIDWAALTRSTISTSVGALARWSRAGVDEYTVQVGKVLCDQLVIPPQTQDYVLERIHELGAIGFLDNALWIGFGIKQVLVDLTESEQGLSLVVLCSALSVRYKDAYGAQVLRHICSQARTPDVLTPAIHKWKALFNLCAGILAGSAFELLLSGIHRLIAPRPVPLDKMEQPTIDSESLATAIARLASLSKGATVSLDFSGTHDLCWIAAFAEWALSLEVAILNSSGSLVYRSQKRTKQDAQAVFHITSAAISSSTIAIRGMNLLKNAETLIRSGRTHGETQLKLSSSWSTILQDTFGDVMHKIIPQCSKLVQESHRDAATLFRYMYEWSDMISQDETHYQTTLAPFLTSHPTRAGFEMALVKRWLPELANMPHVDFDHLRQTKGTNVSPEGVTDLVLLSSLKALHSLCCRNVMSVSSGGGFCGSTTSRFCVVRTIHTICHYIHCLRQVDIGEGVLPSVYGLRHFYTHVGSYQEDKSRSSKFHNILSLNYATVTGDFEPEKQLIDVPIAKAANGHCIHIDSLTNPITSIDRLLRLRLVRGSIYYRDLRFEWIADAHQPGALGLDSVRPHREILKSIRDYKAEALLAESENENLLLLGYRIKPIESSNNPPLQHDSQNMWLSLGNMYFAALQWTCNDHVVCKQSDDDKNHGKWSKSTAIAQVQDYFPYEIDSDKFVLGGCISDLEHVWRTTSGSRIIKFDIIMIYGEAISIWLLDRMSATIDLVKPFHHFCNDNEGSDLTRVREDQFRKYWEKNRFNDHSLGFRRWCVRRATPCFTCQLRDLIQDHSAALINHRLHTMESLILQNNKGQIVGLRVALVLKRRR